MFLVYIYKNLHYKKIYKRESTNAVWKQAVANLFQQALQSWQLNKTFQEILFCHACLSALEFNTSKLK